VNFFAIVPPGLLDGYPVSYVTSFYLPPGHPDVLNAMVQRFPNVLLIDVAQVLGQVQRMMEQVARAVEFIFLFTVAAGLIVLYAAIASSHDERLYQATVMRTLGATRAQLVRANVAEFALLGMLAGILAAAGASGLGYYVAARVLHLPYLPHGTVWIVAIVGGAIGVALAGYLGTRRVLSTSPLQLMRQLG
jgi:putative ABC transport system permease protein